MLGDSTQNEVELFEVIVVIRKKIKCDRTALPLGCFIDEKKRWNAQLSDSCQNEAELL